MATMEKQIEQDLIKKLEDLKYKYRPDIRELQSLNQNFREKFEQLHEIKLTDSEFDRLMQDIISSDVFVCAERLRTQHSFEREDGTPLYYTLVNTKDWCKNSYEVINQLSINTKNSHHRYDVILLINGMPLVQIELKTLQISPRCSDLHLKMLRPAFNAL
ncbi:MAG TPA: type I restriction endonuclease [Agitococcus sp.]|nr:type I restriction endonuclease [Agitococcus sp.]